MVLLLFHFAMTCFMAGVIWIVQVVHYPLFANVGVGGYTDYQRLHMRKITWVVLPAMLLELLTAGLLFLPSFVGLEEISNFGNAHILLVINVVLLVFIWLSTALLQVPLHTKLTDQFSKSVHTRLVKTNWIRTILWTLRVLLLFYLVFVG